jgi:hypothetical protein
LVKIIGSPDSLSKTNPLISPVWAKDDTKKIEKINEYRSFFNWIVIGEGSTAIFLLRYI